MILLPSDAGVKITPRPCLPPIPTPKRSQRTPTDSRKGGPCGANRVSFAMATGSNAPRLRGIGAECRCANRATQEPFDVPEDCHGSRCFNAGSTPCLFRQAAQLSPVAACCRIQTPAPSLPAVRRSAGALGRALERGTSIRRGRVVNCTPPASRLAVTLFGWLPGSPQWMPACSG